MGQGQNPFITHVIAVVHIIHPEGDLRGENGTADQGNFDSITHEGMIGAALLPVKRARAMMKA